MSTRPQQPCDAGYASPTCRLAGRTRRTTRVLGAAAAGSLGVLFIAVVTAVPGPRRERRGAWALKHSARWILRSIGVRTVIHGAPRSGPTLIVGNHTSWLDVLVLASAAPMVMVAGSEVRNWPLIGRAAVQAGTVFMQRDRPRALPDTVAQITAVLRSGSRVQVFPEGATRCGDALGQFHRAAFQAAIDAAVVVSPVTIKYTETNRMSARNALFLPEETTVTSIARILRSGSITVTVRWLPTIPAIARTGKNCIDRAAVARLSQNAVARSLRIP